VAPKSTTVETVLARLAARSHGVVTRQQLLAAGVTSDEIRQRLDTGGLLREHQGVYRVGHRAPSVEARYLAAVRACGEGAVLSGRAAAQLWGMLKGAAPPPEVTAPTKHRVRGVARRRSREVQATTWRGIPVTTVPRTLADLAADLSVDALARACHEASVRYGTTPQQVEAVMGRRGARRLREVLRGDVRVTLSHLERRFRRILDEAGLPLPETNIKADAHRVDCRWPDHRLTVELDSYRYHHTRHAWEQDRRREREAHARGDDVRRYTHGDVFEGRATMPPNCARCFSARSRAGRARAGRRRGGPACAGRPRPRGGPRRPAGA
jgi:putative AbiEi antitoxin of type IV toxin-antitoxin system